MLNLWTSRDTKKAVFATLVPGSAAVAAFAVFVRDQDTLKWWQNARKPSWAFKDLRVYSLIDLATLSPLGLASYYVYKYGGIEYQDTKVALGIYGVNMAAAYASIALIKKRNLKYLYYDMVVLNISAIAAAYKFYQINEHAGLMMVPYALWTGFYALLSYSMYNNVNNHPIN